jgi:hypothetical protein
MTTATTTATTTPNPAEAVLTTARDLYLGWVDASLDANERFARFARVWIDEALGAQQDIAAAIRRALAEAQEIGTPAEGEDAPLAFFSRAGDVARSNYSIWTETGLKAQERFTRVAQTAFEELRGAQTELAQRTEERIGELTRRNSR